MCVSLLPHTQAFLPQEDLGMSLSVSITTLDILIMSLSIVVQALMYGGVDWRYHSGGWPVVCLQGCSQLKASKKSAGQSFVSECCQFSYSHMKSLLFTLS